MRESTLLFTASMRDYFLNDFFVSCSNNLKDEDQLGYLALCPSLRTLTLEGNPLSIMLAESAVSDTGSNIEAHAVRTHCHHYNELRSP